MNEKILLLSMFCCSSNLSGGSGVFELRALSWVASWALYLPLEPGPFLL
jgi:hypothetical protein